jgi:hypothetical protein
MFAWIAHIAFVVLMVIGWVFGELGPRAAGAIVALWCAGLIAAVYFPLLPFSSVVALLDIVLVLLVFKGDVRLR